MQDLQIDVKEIKSAKTNRDILRQISERWSPRSFSEKEISNEVLETMFEAASWAPSAMNGQPWEYLYARKGTVEFDTFVELLMPGNQAWAKNANVLVLSIAKRFLPNGNENRHYLHDVGAANTLLLTQAVEHGVYGHMMGGYYHDKTINELGITDDKEPVCFIALGYLGEPEDLDEPFKSRELAKRTRFPVSEFVKEI